MDLVNADFSDDAQVDRILDTWEEIGTGGHHSSHHRVKGFDNNNDDDGQMGVTENKRAPIWKEIPIMFRRHIMLIIRDRTYNIGPNYLSKCSVDRENSPTSFLICLLSLLSLSRLLL